MRLIRHFFSCCFKIFFFLAFFGLLSAVIIWGWVYYLVVKVPCPEMAPENIASILGRESPVYYRDGKEKIGVLFQGIHRQYLTYEQIPTEGIRGLTPVDFEMAREFGQRIKLLGIAKCHRAPDGGERGVRSIY